MTGPADTLPRGQAVARLAQWIAGRRLGHPTRVAVDGVTASGKSTLARELASAVSELGRPVIQVSMDGFHPNVRVGDPFDPETQMGPRGGGLRGLGYDEPQRPVVARAVAQMSVSRIPRSGREVVAEPVDDPLLDPGLEQSPNRLRGAHLRVEQGLGSSPESFEEPVDAVARRRDVFDPDVAAESVGDPFQRWEPRSVDREGFGQVVLLPGGQSLELEREHHDP